MAKREKKVWDTGMVAHLWANKSQPEARNPRSNLFFENLTLYSYGYHFPVGRHVQNKRGQWAVLLTTWTYSATTNGHISLAKNATRHLQRFFVGDVDCNISQEDLARDQFVQYKSQLLDLGKSYIKARQRKPYILREMESLAIEANSFAKFFGLRGRIKLPADNTKWQAECAKIEKQEAARRRDSEIKREIELKARIAREADRLARWVAGENCLGYGFDYSAPVKLRIVGDTVQTSRGAEVSLDNAVRLYKFVATLKEKGEVYKRSSLLTFPVGAFSLKEMDECGNIKVGCHDIPWSELERLATLAGIS